MKLPDLDRLWTYQPGDINGILREIFVRVDLGPDMLPIGAQPRNPDLFPLPPPNLPICRGRRGSWIARAPSTRS